MRGKTCVLLLLDEKKKCVLLLLVKDVYMEEQEAETGEPQRLISQQAWYTQ